MKHNILVLGAGNFGTCLAQHLASMGNKVTLWARSKETCQYINGKHRHDKYLQSISLSPNIHAISEITTELVKEFKTILLAIPTQSIRQCLLDNQISITSEQLLICAAKGIEIGSQKLPSDIIEELLGQKIAQNMVSLSGPSFAIEVAQAQPTGVSVASRCPERAKKAQEIFHSPVFRAYTSSDPIGLEVAGALKNIIAIAAGACVGLGFQANSKATLITRGLAEMTRFGVAVGANPLTFKGLGGVGDLFLTCSSEKSRNFQVGYQLAQGKSLKDILQDLGSTAEGVSTTKSAKNLGEKLGVSMPITQAVYEVLYNDTPIQKAVHNLLSRDAKPEICI